MTQATAQRAGVIEAKPTGRTPHRGADPREACWPADRFLWAVVDAPGVIHPGPLAPGLWPQLAEQVHVEPDALAAVAVPLGQGRALVCAVERAALATLPTGTLCLTPERLPGCIADDASGSLDHAPARLDLLVGEHLPPACRARARLRHLLLAAGAAGVALLGSVGLSRRAASWGHEARDARSRASLIAAAIDPALTVADLPFLAEQARVQAGSLAGLGQPEPVAPVLADLLSSWPVSTPPTTLSVEHGAILATALVEGDPGEFLAALRPPEGYRLQEPRLAALVEGTQVTLTMTRAEPDGGRP